MPIVSKIQKVSARDVKVKKVQIDERVRKEKKGSKKPPLKVKIVATKESPYLVEKRKMQKALEEL